MGISVGANLAMRRVSQAKLMLIVCECLKLQIENVLMAALQQATVIRAFLLPLHCTKLHK